MSVCVKVIVPGSVVMNAVLVAAFVRSGDRHRVAGIRANRSAKGHFEPAIARPCLAPVRRLERVSAEADWGWGFTIGR